MEGKIKKIVLLSLFLALSIFVMSFYFAKNACAADNDLIITEIMYDPDSTDTGKEWVELYNNGKNDIKIKSGSCGAFCWRFIDQFKDGLPTPSHRHTFSEDATIKSKEFLIVANDKDTFKQNYPYYTGNVIKSSFSLPNEESAFSYAQCMIER